ncbi:hypothetical protein XENOCAPTIV_017512 [Xenoophorus captivus]|uniref:Uncharacterized protein n=1 Tax=Xenoophorus captivus TaxID=1517983 RepID=A0ABV0RHU0_9TELE
MMVDYKRRGERRREYYEKISLSLVLCFFIFLHAVCCVHLALLLSRQKKDPAQFLQVHGRSYKIHLDPAVALAAESPANM